MPVPWQEEWAAQNESKHDFFHCGRAGGAGIVFYDTEFDTASDYAFVCKTQSDIDYSLSFGVFSVSYRWQAIGEWIPSSVNATQSLKCSLNYFRSWTNLWEVNTSALYEYTQYIY